MEPYKAKEMPLEYKIDKEMLRLISEANVKYGEYKSLPKFWNYTSLLISAISWTAGAEMRQDTLSSFYSV